jgi:hypothetical protein
MYKRKYNEPIKKKGKQIGYVLFDYVFMMIFFLIMRDREDLVYINYFCDNFIFLN